MPHQLLSPRTVDMLKPLAGQARTIYFDTHPDAPTGFCLRVSAHGRMYYLVTTNRATKARVWVVVGDARQIGLDAARRAARVKAGDVARGVNPTEAARTERAVRRAEKSALARDARAVTVAQLVERYVGARRLSRVTAREYRRTLVKDIQPALLGGRRASEVIRSDVREFLAPIERRAPAVRDQVLSLLRAAFRWGQDEESAPGVYFVERDPTRGLALVMARRRRTGHLTDEQIPHVWRSVESLGVVRSSYVRLLILLGLRRGEAHVAQWKDVDLERGVWRVPTAVRKVRVERQDDTPDVEAPLSPLAKQLLRELQQVTGKRERLFHFAIGIIGGELQAASGLPKLMIHDLRRTLSYGLERLGAPPHVVSIALGHTGARAMGQTASDLHYVMSKRPDEYRTWLERWANHVEALVEKRRGGKVIAHPSSAGPRSA